MKLNNISVQPFELFMSQMPGQDLDTFKWVMFSNPPIKNMLSSLVQGQLDKLGKLATCSFQKKNLINPNCH